MSTSRKGQTLTYDFFIAMAIFFVALTVIFGYWYYSTTYAEDVSEKNRVANLLFQSSDIWFKEGYPEYWSPDDVKEIGLSNDNQINETKMQYLNDLGYSKLASLLGLGTYKIQYTVYNRSRQVVFKFPSSDDMSSAKNIYKIERVGILNGNPTIIRTIIWY